MEFTREEKEKMCIEAFNKAKYHRYRKRIQLVVPKQIEHIMFGPPEMIDTLYSMSDRNFILYIDRTITLDKGCRSVKSFISRIYNYAELRLRFRTPMVGCNNNETYNSIYTLARAIFDNEELSIVELRNMLKDVSYYMYHSNQERYSRFKTEIELKIATFPN